MYAGESIEKHLLMCTFFCGSFCSGFKLDKLDPSEIKVINESQVRNGDLFCILRLDGVDPLLAWGMGSTNGHTTVALWMDGELYVTESQVSVYVGMSPWIFLFYL